MKYIIKTIQDQHEKIQSSFKYLRKDVGCMDRKAIKQKLLRDIRRRQGYKFSLEGMEYVEIERDKYFKQESECLQQQL